MSDLIAELRERAGHPATGSNTVQCMREAANALEAQREVPEFVTEVIDLYQDEIGTHYPGCYQHHVVCLAVRVKEWAERKRDE